MPIKICKDGIIISQYLCIIRLSLFILYAIYTNMCSESFVCLEGFKTFECVSACACVVIVIITVFVIFKMTDINTNHLTKIIINKSSAPVMGLDLLDGFSSSVVWLANRVSVAVTLTFLNQDLLLNVSPHNYG